MNGIGDATTASIEYALRGLSTRADVRAANLANVNTPGYRAKRVDFESALRAALDGGDVSRAGAAAISADPNLPNANNNTVSLEGDVVGMMKDNLLRDAMVNAFNFKASVLRAAMAR